MQAEHARKSWSRPILVLLLGMLILAPGPFRGRPAEAASGSPDEKLIQALRGMDKGDWYWAKKVVDGLGQKPLSTYARWRELLESNPKPLFKTYAAFLRQHPDWPSLATMQARAEEQIDEKVEHRDRLAFFAERPPRTRQGRVRHAQSLIAAGRTAEGVALLRESWSRDAFPPAEEKYFLGLYRDQLRREDHEARLDRLLWSGEITAAQRMLPFVRKELHPVATARIRLQGLEKKAEAALAAVPKKLRADPGLLYDEVKWLKRRGRETQAQALLARTPPELGRPDLWWPEQNWAIRDLVDDGAFSRAYQIAKVHRQREGAPFAEGEWLAGWIALSFLGQPETAERHFHRLWEGVSSPISRGRAAYWAGRAAEAAGRRAAAREWYDRAVGYPTTFYGQLAAEKLGIELSALLTARTRASAAAREQLRRREPAAVARILCRLSNNTAAPFFRHLGHTAAGDADALRAVVELAEECGRPDLMIVAAKAATREAGDVEPHAAFPAPLNKALRLPAASLPEPALRLAVARQESQFDPRAASSAGALGLMQLLPSTAEAMAKKLGLPYAKSRLTRDPEYNARLGSYYLGRQLDRWKNEPALALAAYNAGPSRVVRWLEAYGDPRGASVERLVDWIELIPFSETRNYVQRVLEARAVYDVLLRRERGPGRQPEIAPVSARTGS